jgi:hypothetical protein
MNIFLSHVSTEGVLALVLKHWIQIVFNNRIKVFVSSDLHNITAGDIWLGNLRAAFMDARVLIVLCSPYSVTRPWVNFETGGAWFKNIPVIPLCHSGQRLDNLPSPLFFFHGLDIHSPNFPEKLMQNLMIQAKLRKKPKLSKRGKERMMEEIASTLLRITVATPSRTNKPHQDKVGITLKKIATSNDEDCMGSKLANSLNMDPNDLDVYLRHLMDRRFIAKKSNKDGDCRYTTTKIGRNYLVQNDLLDFKSST